MYTLELRPENFGAQALIRSWDNRLVGIAALLVSQTYDCGSICHHTDAVCTIEQTMQARELRPIVVMLNSNRVAFDSTVLLMSRVAGDSLSQVGQEKKR